MKKKQIALFIKEAALDLHNVDIPMKIAVVNVAVNAVIVIIAAIFLPDIAAGIAETTGLDQSFVGNIFVAISTSLPEVVVSLAAVKLAQSILLSAICSAAISSIFLFSLLTIFCS